MLHTALLTLPLIAVVIALLALIALCRMAPEIILNWKTARRKRDSEGNMYRGETYLPSADCYSLGIILWECVTAQRPFYPYPIVEATGQELHGAALGDYIVQGLRFCNNDAYSFMCKWVCSVFLPTNDTNTSVDS